MINCEIKIENILTAPISATQKYWIISALKKTAEESGLPTLMLEKLMEYLYCAKEQEQ